MQAPGDGAEVRRVALGVGLDIIHFDLDVQARGFSGVLPAVDEGRRHRRLALQLRHWNLEQGRHHFRGRQFTGVLLDRGIDVRRICHRSEEHTSELQSLMRISYAVFCLKKKKHNNSIYYKSKDETTKHHTQ